VPRDERRLCESACRRRGGHVAPVRPPPTTTGSAHGTEVLVRDLILVIAHYQIQLARPRSRSRPSCECWPAFLDDDHERRRASSSAWSALSVIKWNSLPLKRYRVGTLARRPTVSRRTEDGRNLQLWSENDSSPRTCSLCCHSLASEYSFH
jgi:hypothetical protein